MRLKSSAMLIAIVLAILISGAVTAVSYFVLVNRDNTARLALSNIAYYNAYSAVQDALKSYGRTIERQVIYDNLGKRHPSSVESDIAQINTNYYLSINPISLGKTQDGSSLGPADGESPTLLLNDQLVYFVAPDQEVDFYWSKLKKGGSEIDEDVQISFELTDKAGQLSGEKVSLKDGFHKNIKGCNGLKDDFCELRVSIEAASAKNKLTEGYVNYAINPNANYGNLTNFSIISIGQVKLKTGELVERKLVARFDLISKRLINIMEYDCQDCDK